MGKEEKKERGRGGRSARPSGQKPRLLEDGHNPAEKVQGWTPLMKAYEEGHVDIIEALINIDVDLEAANRKGWTAISFVATPWMNRPTQFGAIRFFLQKGADRSKKDEHGKT